MFNPLKALIGLFFPNLCMACSEHEPVHQGLFCHFCWTDLPRYSDLKDNKELLEKKLPLIRTDVARFHGLFLYTKGGKIQDILHDIKYHGKAYKAVSLGRWLGEQVDSEQYDALIPVPIHTKKKRKRGYNQAAQFAKGIGDTAGIKTINNALKKAIDTSSQTGLNRASRHTNVSKAYQQGAPLPDHVKRVLLVDDVITTGATLEVCTTLLQQDQDVIVDYAFIAMAV